LRGGKSGPALDEGDVPNSLFFRKIVGDDAGTRMPPTGALPEGEIAILRAWAEKGAPWDPEASFSRQHEVSPEGRRLFEALRRGDLPALRRSLDEKPDLVNAVDEDGSSLLTLAAYWGESAEMQELLSRGADVHATNDGGMTALIPAGDDLGKTRLLVEAGADVNQRTSDGQTALFAAARRAGATPVVSYLLEKGADVAAKDDHGRTALHRAATCGDLTTLATLLANGANIDAVSNSGRTPLIEAVYEDHTSAFQFLLERKATAHLGAAANAVSIAARNGNLTIVQGLLSRGVELEGAREPDAVLLSACGSYRANPEIVKLLLERGANPRARSPAGDTPLKLASARGHARIVELLTGAIKRRKIGEEVQR
jgi:ankyrin repeat protein